MTIYASSCVDPNSGTLSSQSRSGGEPSNTKEQQNKLTLHCIMKFFFSIMNFLQMPLRSK